MASPGPGPKPQRPLWHFILPGLFVGALFISLWERRPEPLKPLKLQGETMGTIWSATLLVPLKDDRRVYYNKVIQDALDDVNHKMSTWSSRSELSMFNASRSLSPQPMSQETLLVLKTAQSVHSQSDGAFDVTIGPLVQAWGFGVGEAEDPPSAENIAEMLGQVGSELIELDLEANTVTKLKSDIQVDLSAIAKGFGVDQVHRALSRENIQHFMIEVGGEVRSLGLNPSGKSWRIGIDKPDADKGVLSGAVDIKDMAIATSGDYRNYKEINGKRISHTIDPRTGKPITHRLASVTILAKTAMEADAWATAINVLGPKDGMDLANARAMPALMILRSDKGGFEIEESAHFEPYAVRLSP